MHDPGTAAVERRVGHGQDEVVLRIDGDPAAVDVGDVVRPSVGTTGAGCAPES